MFKTYLRYHINGECSSITMFTIFIDKEGDEQTMTAEELFSGNEKECEDHLKWWEENGAEVERIESSGMSVNDYYD